jgi:hypothetical protein
MASSIRREADASLRGRRFPDPDELREVVLGACKREFQHFAGRPWSADWGSMLTAGSTAEANETDEAAARLLKKIREALLEGAQFQDAIATKGLPPTGSVSDLEDVMLNGGRDSLEFLLNIKPATFGRAREFRSFEKWARRERLVWHLTYHRTPPDFPRLGARTSRRKMAVISLLAGEFPEASAPRGGFTVALLIQVEMRAIGRAQTANVRHGGEAIALGRAFIDDLPK